MQADNCSIDRFTVKINIGGSAMNSPDDLSRALIAIAGKLSAGEYYAGHSQTIRDENGNDVGRWKLHLEGVE